MSPVGARLPLTENYWYRVSELKGPWRRKDLPAIKLEAMERRNKYKIWGTEKGNNKKLSIFIHIHSIYKVWRNKTQVNILIKSSCILVVATDKLKTPWGRKNQKFSLPVIPTDKVPINRSFQKINYQSTTQLNKIPQARVSRNNNL